MGESLAPSAGQKLEAIETCHHGIYFPFVSTFDLAPLSGRIPRGEWLLSRRDRLIVGRHEVPENRSPREPSRRVRYDQAQLIAHISLKALSNIWDSISQASSLQ
jgi:hypothetical protein